MKTRECYGCKGIYPESPDLTAYETYGVARYGVAIPECMAALSEILVRENELFGYPQPAHRLIVDAAGLQHLPHLSIQKKLGIEQRLINASVQSIWIHGLGLYCIFEKQMTAQEAGLCMKKTLDKTNKLGQNKFVELKPPSDLGKITALDIRNKVIEKNVSLEEYTQLAHKWAKSVWDAWKDQHAAFAQLYKKYCNANELKK